MHNIRIKLYNTIMEIEEYIQYHETKLHEQPGFSYNTYLCTIPLDFPSVPMHWHEQMEIIYIKKGNGTVSVGMKPYEVSAGCIIPVMPGELHSIDGSTGGPMEYENIIFSLDLLDSTEQNDWCRSSVIIPMKENLFELKVRTFLDAIKEGGEAPVPSSQILYNQAIIDGIAKSAAAGREVEIEIPEI